MTRTDAIAFITWLLSDVSRRQDAHGTLLLPGRRRFKAGKRVVIYSRKALQANVNSDYCGIIWQDCKRGRDNDQLWRLASSVLLLEECGSGRWKACHQLVLLAGENIAPLVRRRTPVKKLVNDHQEDAERLRVRVSRYITRSKKAGVDLRQDLRSMMTTYEWLHRQELGDQYYQELRNELIGRVTIADECYERNDWGRVETRLAVASLAHEFSQYDEAVDWYKHAYDVLEGMDHLYKDVYLPWIRQQIERCHSKEAPEPSPVLIGNRLVLPEEVKEGNST